MKTFFIFHAVNEKERNSRSSLLRYLRLAFYIIAPFETLYSTGCVYDPLLSGEKGMAFTAKLYLQLFLGRPRLKPVAAGA
jgi:hypothetical protein